MAQQKLKSVTLNTAPLINVTCERNDLPINLASATADLILTFNGAVTNAGHTAAAVTSASGGVISYSIQTGDFAQAGNYTAETKISYGDGTFERLYEKFTIKVRAATS